MATSYSDVIETAIPCRRLIRDGLLLFYSYGYSSYCYRRPKGLSGDRQELFFRYLVLSKLCSIQIVTSILKDFLPILTITPPPVIKYL